MVRLALCLLPALLTAQQVPLRMNDIQIIGSHNSYHAGLAPSELSLLRQRNPQAADSLAYSHPPLQQQLDRGVRQFELDVYSDPAGGLFAEPSMIPAVAKAGLPADPPFDPRGVMQRPGFKVVHVKDIDFRSSCQPLTECLSIIRDWSRKHPRHLPIFILLENKEKELSTAIMGALEAEVAGVFPRAHLLTPDDVRGTARTLEEAVLNNGWPSLESARGKIVLLLDQERATPFYATEGRRSLEGRLMFTNAAPGSPDAAFIKRNEAMSPSIPELVRKGYLVRTMTDGGVARVRANDTKTRDAAMASGAQILSSDYPFDHVHPNGFSVRFPGNAIARCNPVRTTPVCSAAAIAE